MREHAPADRGFTLHRVPFQNKVRSDRFQECWKFGGIFSREQFLGFTTANDHLPHGFEPIAAVLFSVLDVLIERNLTSHQLVLPRKVFSGVERSLQPQIKKGIELVIGILPLIFKMLNRSPIV
ncbi:MAG: hypothetical protein V1876_01100 [Candidatus Peregrinibacteria bacterium]